MKIGFMGLGKLGLPCAMAIENCGHSVLGYDPDPIVKEILETRKLPYREEGAQELLDKTKIRVVSVERLVTHSQIVFVAIQTPHDPKFEGITRLTSERKDFEYSYLETGVSQICEEAKKQKKALIVVVISTVLPGTMRERIMPLLNGYTALVYCPYFIAMGTCCHDFENPEFVLLGVDDADAARVVSLFYRTIHNAPIRQMRVASAELCKVAYNTAITSKICIANTMMEICQKTDANIDDVTQAMQAATDRLVSPRYMTGGMGDGGGCHVRDNIALSWLAQKLDLSYDWFSGMIQCREKQAEWLTHLMLLEAVTKDLPLVILGKAFKPETNLVVGSPAVLCANILREAGHHVDMYDPEVDEEPIELGDEPAVFLIGTRHEVFQTYKFPEGSVVIDPHRYIPDQEGVKVVRVGE